MNLLHACAAPVAVAIFAEFRVAVNGRFLSWCRTRSASVSTSCESRSFFFPLVTKAAKVGPVRFFALR